MAEREVSIRAVLRDLFTGPAKKLRGEAGAVTKQLNSMGKAAAFVSGNFGALFGGAAILAAAQKALQAAREDSEAQQALLAALEGRKTALEDIKGLVDQIRAATKLTDDELLQTSARLVNMQVPLRQIPRSLQAAVDTSAALGSSLEEVVNAIGQFDRGAAGLLGRKVPSLVEAVKDGGLTLESGLGILERQFGGQAALQAQTTFGRIQQISNEIDEAWERIGRGIAGATVEGKELQLTLTELLADTVEAGAKFAKLVQGGAKTIKEFFFQDGVPLRGGIDAVTASIDQERQAELRRILADITAAAQQALRFNEDVKSIRRQTTKTQDAAATLVPVGGIADLQPQDVQAALTTIDREVAEPLAAVLRARIAQAVEQGLVDVVKASALTEAIETAIPARAARLADEALAAREEEIRALLKEVEDQEKRRQTAIRGGDPERIRTETEKLAEAVAKVRDTEREILDAEERRIQARAELATAEEKIRAARLSGVDAVVKEADRARAQLESDLAAIADLVETGTISRAQGIDRQRAALDRFDQVIARVRAQLVALKAEFPSISFELDKMDKELQKLQDRLDRPPPDGFFNGLVEGIRGSIDSLQTMRDLGVETGRELVSSLEDLSGAITDNGFTWKQWAADLLAALGSLFIKFSLFRTVAALLPDPTAAAAGAGGGGAGAAVGAAAGLAPLLAGGGGGAAGALVAGGGAAAASAAPAGTTTLDGVASFAPAAATAAAGPEAGFFAFLTGLFAGGAAEGGWIHAGVRGRDSAFIGVSRDEYVHPSSTTDYYGLAGMRAIHERRVPADVVAAYAGGSAARGGGRRKYRSGGHVGRGGGGGVTTVLPLDRDRTEQLAHAGEAANLRALGRNSAEGRAALGLRRQ